MAVRNGKENLAVWVPVDVAERFKAAARISDGGVAQALTRLVGEALGDQKAVTPKGAGQGKLVSVRFRNDERFALAQAAHARATTPANWVRSLALVHLMRRPEWNPDELAALRAISTELRRIGVNVNQIAHTLNAAALVGECPPGQGEAAARAVELVKIETRRLAAAVTGNFDYYGFPWDEIPKPARGALTRRNMKEEAEAASHKRKPKLRPKKFRDGKGTGRD